MKSAVVTIQGVSPYSQSKFYETPKLSKELPAAYGERTWRDRQHLTPDGYVEIPATSLANCIKDAAKFLAIPVPGKGKATFTKNFDAGVMVVEGIKLAAKGAETSCDRLFVPSDGKPGGGRRVIKFFPRIDTWGGTFTAMILDDMITADVFAQVVKASGQLIGLGRFRPRNRGFYGRFIVKSIAWQDEEATLARMEKAS